ncbi:MAG: hypothetical protein WCH34_17815, partial [Bacteroidota bacterium]
YPTKTFAFIGTTSTNISSNGNLITSGLNNPTLAAASIVYNLSGGGALCNGSSNTVNINLSGSQNGFIYQLKKDGVNYGTALTGSGNSISWTITEAGTYTCSTGITNMNGSVIVNEIASPTGNATQSFCSGATVANLTASGTAIQWYAAASGGSPLPTSSVLQNGNHYYASQTIGGCESRARFEVSVTVFTIPVIVSTTPGYVCGPGLVTLYATASSGVVKWYTVPTGGTNIAAGSSYITGNLTTTTNYYVESNNNGCISEQRTLIVAEVRSIPSVSSTTNGSRCGTGAVILQATASSGTINWFNAANGGTSIGTGSPFATPSISSTTTFYAGALDNGCSSISRLAAIANIYSAAAPTGNTAQSFCNQATVANLVVSGTNIKWYDAAIGGNLLSSNAALTTMQTYYASQTLGTCESQDRLGVNVSINMVAAPTGNPTQTFNNNSSTIADLIVAGTSLKWYDAPLGGNLLASNLMLINGNSYYGSQTIAGCESQNRLKVTVTLNLFKIVNLHLMLQGLFDFNTTAMTEAQDMNWVSGISFAKYGAGIADKIKIDLFEENPPYHPIGVSVSDIDLYTNGLAIVHVPSSLSGNYFIRVSNRNHLATWSAYAVPFNSDTVSFDFTLNQLNAYQAPGGIDPQIQLTNGLFGFYLGDLDQNFGVDFDDYNVFEPYLNEGVYGFTIADINGNGLVDFDDFNLFEPVLYIGPFTQYPGMQKK